MSIVARVLVGLTCALTTLLCTVTPAPTTTALIQPTARCADAVQLARTVIIEWLRWYAATAEPHVEFGPLGTVIARNERDLASAVRTQIVNLARCDVGAWTE